LDDSWVKLLEWQEIGGEIATYDGVMRRISLFATGLLIISTITGGPAKAALPATDEPVAYKYRSCSYPKSKPGEYKPNAASWKAQGFSDAVKGIDVSVWQHPNDKAIDFAALKSKYDVSFVIIKGSDGGPRGNDNAKKWFPIDSAAARAEGIVVGSYHYAQPGNMDENTITDAKLQAQRAVEQAEGAKVGDLPLTLDMEELPCGWTIQRLAKWTSAFLIEAEAITGRTPILYTNSTFIGRLQDAGASDLSRYPLWLAKWGPKLGTDPKENRIWNNDWLIWQFTADGKISAVPSSTTDLNVFKGTQEEFQEFINR
jgi:GH25 family lysozyme M1 (1,4-beta-N-acetylmuramidase)